MPYSFNPLSGLGLDQSIPLDGAGKIPSDYLPSYVDDVVEYANLAGFPATGETGKIYVAIDTGFTYRWSGSVYIQINSLTGTFAADAGTAAAPSISIGTADNGLYAPAEDQVAISTNGTGRLFVDASGRLLTGTSSTSVVCSALFQGRSDGATNSALIRLAKGSSTPGASDSLGIISFADSGVQAAAQIQVSRDGGTWTSGSRTPGAMIFFTAPDSASAPQERLRITSDGKLGLGTSSPSKPFHVQGSQDLALFEATDAGATGAEITLRHTSASPANNDIISRINFSGLDSGLNVTTYTFIEGIATDVVNNQETGAIAFSTRSVGTFAERMRLTGTGLGIGTTTVNAILHIKAATPLPIIESSTSNSAQLFFKNSSSALTGFYTGITASNEGLLWQSENNVIRIGTNNSERARIDSSGRLLVGTSTSAAYGSYTAQLQISGSNENTSSLSLHRTNGSPYLTLNTGATSGTAGNILFQGYDGTSAYVPLAQIAGVWDGTGGVGDGPGRLVFSTTADGASSPTERMRIASDGNVGIATGAPGERLGVSGKIRLQSGNAPYVNLANAGDGANAFDVDTTTTVGNGSGLVRFYNNGVQKCRIEGDGSLQNATNSYGAFSDIKLKENIVNANSQWDDLKALQVRNYNLKAETLHQTHTQIGLIAQEVELVSPGLVSESPDRDEDGNDLGTVTKSVNYSVLYMKAVKALQEAMERIEVLEAKVNALEGN
jgi:hypothetical protein